MKAILLVCLILLAAVTNTASAAARTVPSRAGAVLADATTLVHTLDLKSAPAGSGLAEYVVDTLGRRFDRPGARNTPRRVEGKIIQRQKLQPSHFGRVFYPMRN